MARRYGGGSGWSSSYNQTAKGRRARYRAEFIDDSDSSLPFLRW